MSAGTLPDRLPQPGQIVQVRSRRWFVDEVVKDSERPTLDRLACADDDAQGELLDALWDYELDRRILDEERWDHLAARGFDAPRTFAAYLNTLRWGSVTTTDPSLFQSPFRAGIKIDATRWSRCARRSAFPEHTSSSPTTPASTGDLGRLRRLRYLWFSFERGVGRSGAVYLRLDPVRREARSQAHELLGARRGCFRLDARAW